MKQEAAPDVVWVPWVEGRSRDGACGVCIFFSGSRLALEVTHFSSVRSATQRPGPAPCEMLHRLSHKPATHHPKHKAIALDIDRNWPLEANI